METPLNTQWHVHSFNDTYTQVVIAYGTNQQEDGPKGIVCTIEIDSSYPIEVRQAIMDRIVASNDLIQQPWNTLILTMRVYQLTKQLIE